MQNIINFLNCKFVAIFNYKDRTAKILTLIFGYIRGAGVLIPLDKLLPPLNFKQKFKLKSQITPTTTVILNEMHNLYYKHYSQYTTLYIKFA